MAMVAMINNISSTMAPMPGLTQNDCYVPYCNSKELPSTCNSNSPCYCTHLVQLDYCKPYAFVLKNIGRMHLHIHVIKHKQKIVYTFFSDFCI